MAKENEKASSDSKPDPGAKLSVTPGGESGEQGAVAGALSAASGSEEKAKNQDAISLLKADHRKVEGLFKQFETAAENEKPDLVRRICSELTVHAILEEEIFYPACRQDATRSLLDEAQVEHDSAKLLIMDLLSGTATLRDAKVKVLAEQITTHIKEEEAPDGVFAKSQKAGINTAELGTQLNRRKQDLMAQAERNALPSPRLVSLHPFTHQPAQEDKMARQSNDRDRDERGRFTSEDDDHRSRSYSARGGDGGRERDEQGRFTDEDDRGRSYGGRNGGQERDTRGRFAGEDDDRGYRSRDRYDADDHRRSSGSRGEGGWFGDFEGHSEASRRGWDERGGSHGRATHRDEQDRDYRSRGRDDHDDRSRSSGGRGQSGWYGDSEGHSEASRRGWDHREGGRSSRDEEDRSFAERGGGRDREYDDRRGRSGGRGEGGWFGDSQGHSEAARAGWQDRNGGGSRGRGRDDDDDRGHRSSGGGRDRGHGGWFGDSEGHAEAARRGWEDRR